MRRSNHGLDIIGYIGELHHAVVDSVMLVPISEIRDGCPLDMVALRLTMCVLDYDHKVVSIVW